jgi:hypothetical protein
MPSHCGGGVLPRPVAPHASTAAQQIAPPVPTFMPDCTPSRGSNFTRQGGQRAPAQLFHQTRT